VVFDDLVPFDPLLEVVSSFKRILKQAALFEYRVGRGRLLVCTLNLSGDDPAARWLRAHLVRYVESSAFAPARRIEADTLLRWVQGGSDAARPAPTDMGFDSRAKSSRADT